MNRLLFILAIIMALPASGKYNALPARYAGSMMPYDLSREEIQTVWADSLTPVYMARVARHGARYISSASKLDRLKAAIAEARERKTLTKEGERFNRLLSDVETATADRWGDLSEVGVTEEHRLADGIFTMLPELFRTARINAISSYVPRVVKTAYEFTYQLTSLSGHTEITVAEGRRFNPLLRCFETDKDYAAWRKSGAWKEQVALMTDSLVSPAPARRIFGAYLSDKDARQLTLDIYDILQSLSAFGLPAATDEFMTAQEYEDCWKIDNLTHYLRNSISPLSDLAGKATSPLLARIIADADRSLSGRVEKAADRAAGISGPEDDSVADMNLYFGHAETLMPLLSLMRVEGCYYDSPDLSTLYERWKDYDVVPLGANLDIILLEAPSGTIHTALRHNGTYISPMPGSGMTVEWNAYRQYLISNIRTLQDAKTTR
ncbi:MAG: histidine phosphatase family protein [Muribaculaceae bacterium]|nr:histidine phosphatase family protein [Muribaculaceae bacterium]